VRRALAFLIPLAAIAAAGCGGDNATTLTATSASFQRAPIKPTGAYMTTGALTLGVANSFRSGLDRLAVLTQKGDDAVDLGQSLPTGVLDRVRCAPTGARPVNGSWAWACTVRWRSAVHRPQTTRYRISVAPAGCFNAYATPPRDARFDPTIRAYSEDPLNRFGSYKPGC
jgi:hypothetical protein